MPQIQKAQIKYMLMAAGLISAAILLYLFNPENGLFPRCPFHLSTGLYCPGCGSQRAVHHLVHGHVRTATDFNLLLVLSIPLLILHFTLRLLKRKSLFYDNRFVYTFLILVIGFWIVRNIPAYPFDYLAP
jgi:hypothetical protein